MLADVRAFGHAIGVRSQWLSCGYDSAYIAPEDCPCPRTRRPCERARCDRIPAAQPCRKTDNASRHGRKCAVSTIAIAPFRIASGNRSSCYAYAHLAPLAEIAAQTPTLPLSNREYRRRIIARHSAPPALAGLGKFGVARRIGDYSRFVQC